MFKMTTEMQRHLGYDEDGNHPDLLAPADADALENGTWRRADQAVECVCGSAFWTHPRVQGALWLVRTCEGLVKL